MRYTTGQTSEWRDVTLPARWSEKSIAQLGRDLFRRRDTVAGNYRYGEQRAEFARCEQAKQINPRDK